VFNENAVVTMEFYYSKGHLVYFRDQCDYFLITDKYIDPNKWPRKKDFEWLFYFNHGKLIYRNTLPGSTYWDIDAKAVKKIIYKANYLFNFLTSKHKGSAKRAAE
jgi:hypothetical protein